MFILSLHERSGLIGVYEFFIWGFVFGFGMVLDKCLIFWEFRVGLGLFEQNDAGLIKMALGKNFIRKDWI